MSISINGVELSDAEVENELPWHQDSDAPLHNAVMTRILRRVLLDEAQRLGMDTRNEEEAVSALLATQAPSPQPDDAACRRFYDANPGRFTAGGCVQAEHILFQVTPQVDLPALRLLAEDVLKQALQTPADFGRLARQYSNCPSAALDGSLGQVTMGSMVPEFERAIFAVQAGTVHPKLVHSRHGLHIVRVTHAVAGRLQPYEAVAQDIADVLQAMGRDTAWRQYIKILLAGARIEGIDLDVGMNQERVMAEEVHL
ncbi:MAG: peptidylprolyl isomerase [Alcaligenaceae bacterium]|nr:peptidylprolyl isomerase [Alcaligenaceae bacterium]